MFCCVIGALVEFGSAMPKPASGTLSRLTGAEALRVRTHAQLEDNSKEHLEVFLDTRPDRGVIARVLWEYVEVHIALSHGGQTVAENHVASEPTAMVMNTVGQSELALFYRRQVAETAPLFGGHVPFDEVCQRS